MIPKISARPAASMNSSSPYCTLLSNWIRKVAKSMVGKQTGDQVARRVASKRVPINVNRPPEMRLNQRMRAPERKTGASRATPSAHSVRTVNSKATKVLASTANCGAHAAVGSRNWGKNAVKNSRALGLLPPTIRPWMYSLRAGTTALVCVPLAGISSNTVVWLRNVLMPSQIRYAAPAALSTQKAVSDAASNAPRPRAESNMVPSTAVTLPAAAARALRGPCCRELVMHMSIVGPGERTSRAMAAVHQCIVSKLRGGPDPKSSTRRAPGSGVSASAHAAAGTAVGQGLGGNANHIVFLVLDAAQVDVLHGVVCLAHRPLAARAVDGGAFHRLDDGSLGGQVALDGVGALHQQKAGVVALYRVHIGLAAEGLGVFQAELLVARCVQRVAVVHGRDDAFGSGAGSVQHAFCEEARAVQRNLVLEACGRIVLDELGSTAAREEAGHGVGLESGDFGQQRLEFHVGEGQTQFLHDGAAGCSVALLEAFEGFVPCRVFPGDPHSLLVALFDHGFAQGQRGLGIAERSTENVGGTQCARGGMHAGVGNQVENPRIARHLLNAHLHT